ncbi:hypothetical protein BH18GEM1_BH18GEM1_15270 [soil metagenome]
MSGPSAAFFDVDGTLVEGDIVRYGVEIRTAGMTPLLRRLWIAGFLPRVPWYLALDAVSRPAFQRAFYRLYRAVPPALLRERAVALFHSYVEPRLYPAGMERILRHRGRGHRVVLVTGSLDPIVAPLAAHVRASDVIAARLEVESGVHTGALAGPPLAGAEKAAAVAAYVRDHGLDAAACFAYADSADDLPMLESVGRAAAVNPDRRLARAARARGWDVLEWRLGAANAPTAA